jgi:hypothetical protein
MAPFFTIFCDRKSTTKQTEIVKTLETYYICFIDSENQTHEIKRKYANSNHRFFGLDRNKWLMYELSVVESIPPAFVLTFDVDQFISKKDWKLAYDFVKTIFSLEPDEQLIKDMAVLVPTATIVEKLTVAPAKDVVKQNNEYMFSHHINNEKDFCLCQIEKPFTDKPYTCMIENFRKEGFLPMFTAYYICTSWGVCSQDHIFLAHLWKHLDMSKVHGEFNLEQRLRQNIEECKNGKPEPRVYRLDTKEVLKLFEEKQVAEIEKQAMVDSLVKDMDMVE